MSGNEKTLNFYGNTVTVTLTKRKPVFEIGQLVRIKRKKRVWGEIFKTDGYSNLSISPVYRPAPRSRLNNKRVFSKHKGKIIKMTQNI